jgi:hypothetical protein
MKTLNTVAIPLCFALALVGCGGGSSKSGTASPTAAANLSASQFDIGSDIQITLNSSGSEAKNGALTAYAWSVASAPQYSNAQPENIAAASTGFVPDMPGAYSLCLTVTDEKKTSAPDCKTLKVTNSIPIALLGEQTIVLVGQQYQLDASRSLLPTNGIASLMTYEWAIERAPEGSEAQLDNSTQIKPRFTADLDGDYVFALTVSYEGVVSEKATIKLIANKTNALPIAKAGDAINSWVLGEKVTLDGSGSYDPDGDKLQYRWGFGYNPSLFAGTIPTGSQAVLENAETATPSFVPDMIGTYNLWLQVYDGTSISRSSMQVVVDKLPAGHVNSKPIAFISPAWGKTYEAELGSKVSFTATYSYDKETLPNVVHNIGKKWRLVSHPVGFDPAVDAKLGEYGTAEAPSYSITFTREGDYVVEVQVFDGELWSDPVTQVFTARTGANRPPVANPAVTGVGTTVGVNQLITLDGEKSTDPDNNQLSYKWTLLQRPDGSAATLSSATSAFPTFTTDVAGPYLFELTVTDSHGFSSDPKRLQILAKSRNNMPVARPSLKYKVYDQVQPLAIYPAEPVDLTSWTLGDQPWHNSVNFVADAYDPDGDELSYLWSLLGAGSEHQFGWAVDMGLADYMSGGTCTNGYTINPQGPYTTPAKLYTAVMALRDWTCPDLKLAPVNPGNYSLQLLVSDGIDTAGPYEFTIPAVKRENYPSLLLERVSVGRVDGQQEQQDINDYAKQQLFPHTFVQNGAFPMFDSYFEPSESYVNTRYTLTAFDQDYTVINLKAVSEGLSAEYGYSISFDGLTEGQVIAKGQSITFSLVLHTPAIIKAHVREWYEPPVNLGSDLRWSFEIKEKAGWTFSHIPYIYPSRS